MQRPFCAVKSAAEKFWQTSQKCAHLDYKIKRCVISKPHSVEITCCLKVCRDIPLVPAALISIQLVFAEDH